MKNLVYLAAVIVALVFVDVASAQIQLGLVNINRGGSARFQAGVFNRNDAGNQAQFRQARRQNVVVKERVVFVEDRQAQFKTFSTGYYVPQQQQQLILVDPYAGSCSQSARFAIRGGCR